jgi:hypothetical protein
VAHAPKNDLLGSFVTPTLFLAAICDHHGWTLEIIPFAGSDGEAILKANLALGHDIDATWGSGFVDASNRAGYDPVALNAAAYDTMGFFPQTLPSNYRQSREWISLGKIPKPGEELENECRTRHNQAHVDRRECNILLPEDPYVMEQHMKDLGGYDVVFSDEFRARVRSKFLETNRHRLTHYKDGGNGEYNIAIHIRRGDITADYRWIEQSVFANLARTLCANRPDAKIHVFSSGKNRDGSWTTMENLVQSATENGPKCASVAIHLDELEFDTWTHMVAADVFIMSKSNFGLIPSLLARGQVYFPHDYWHLRLASFHLFDAKTGVIMP